MVKRLKVIPEQYLHLMGKIEQHAYFLRVRHQIRQDRANNCPCWLYFLTLAYFYGKTSEIEGTPIMSAYRDVLLNQQLP